MSVNIPNSNFLSQTPAESSPTGNSEPTNSSAPQGFSKILSQKAQDRTAVSDTQPASPVAGEAPSADVAAAALLHGLDWSTTDAVGQGSGNAMELVESSGDGDDSVQSVLGLSSETLQDDSGVAVPVLPFSLNSGDMDQMADSNAAGLGRAPGKDLPPLVSGMGPETDPDIGGVRSSPQAVLQGGTEASGVLSAKAADNTSTEFLQSAGQALMGKTPSVMTGVDNGDMQALNVRPTADSAGVVNALAGDAGRPGIGAGPDAARPSSLLLEQPVHSKNWEDGLGDRILWLVNNRQSVAELRLTPPQLGTVDVRIAVQGDQAQVAFQVPVGTARDAVEAALPRLREMFAEAGMNLLDVGVSDHPSHQGSNGEAESDADPSGLEAAASETMADTASAQVAAIRSTGQLDLFV